MDNEIITLRERIVIKDEIIADLHKQYGKEINRLKTVIREIEKFESITMDLERNKQT